MSKIVFEGSLELNPLFQRDVDSMKFVSPRFLLALLLSSSLITIQWTLSMPWYPDVYALVLGGVICMELAIHVRHLGNLHLSTSRLTAEQLRGRIEYDRPLTLRRSAVQIFGFAILFAVIFAFTGSWFAAGGAGSCLGLSIKHWILAYRASAKRAANLRRALAE